MSSEQLIRTAVRRLEVLNRKGLHARPSAHIVRLLDGFECEVMLELNGLEADTHSIMDLLSLSAGMGNELTARAEGPDAAAALDALEQLFARKFGED